VAVADRVAVAGWQWAAWLQRVIAVILSGDNSDFGFFWFFFWLFLELRTAVACKIGPESARALWAHGLMIHMCSGCGSTGGSG
jgi:hypothetical protein